METTNTWADAPAGGTRMTLRNAGESSGFGALAGPLRHARPGPAHRPDLRFLEAPKRHAEEFRVCLRSLVAGAYGYHYI